MTNSGEVSIQGKRNHLLILRYNDKSPELSVSALQLNKVGVTVELDRAGAFRLLEELAAAIEVAWPD